MTIVAQGNSYRITSDYGNFYIEAKIKNSEGDIWVPIDKKLSISAVRLAYGEGTIVEFRIKDIIDFLRQNVFTDYSKVELPPTEELPESDIPF